MRPLRAPAAGDERAGIITGAVSRPWRAGQTAGTGRPRGRMNPAPRSRSAESAAPKRPRWRLKARQSVTDSRKRGSWLWRRTATRGSGRPPRAPSAPAADRGGARARPRRGRPRGRARGTEKLWLVTASKTAGGQGSAAASARTRRRAACGDRRRACPSMRLERSTPTLAARGWVAARATRTAPAPQPRSRMRRASGRYGGCQAGAARVASRPAPCTRRRARRRARRASDRRQPGPRAAHATVRLHDQRASRPVPIVPAASASSAKVAGQRRGPPRLTRAAAQRQQLAMAAAPRSGRRAARRGPASSRIAAAKHATSSTAVPRGPRWWARPRTPCARSASRSGQVSARCRPTTRGAPSG